MTKLEKNKIPWDELFQRVFKSGGILSCMGGVVSGAYYLYSSLVRHCPVEKTRLGVGLMTVGVVTSWLFARKIGFVNFIKSCTVHFSSLLVLLSAWILVVRLLYFLVR
ncbi:MAG: hypothetical protein OXF02_07340 [Simkaniaceae bacterium]|nr:hypothetical protein [Simkaniaceae bacterium]